MNIDLARELMDRFAEDSGITGSRRPRRYLWTDAYAVYNFLALAEWSGDDRYLTLARELVDQVHRVLGRHRDDDSRKGWISGLPEEEGEKHPVIGGLRIGKPFNERARDQPPDPRLEWEQDGQYFHYLTKWMQALHRMGRSTGESRYRMWAIELAKVAHKGFTHTPYAGGPKRMVWKMSIDLSRPLVAAMGQQDPLDGLITFLELQSSCGGDCDDRQLASAITDMGGMVRGANWETDDPLGIGGLLDNATRLSQLVFGRNARRQETLHRILIDALRSLVRFNRSGSLDHSAEHRLAFRELGLSIGLHGLNRIRDLVAADESLTAVVRRLQPYGPLADRIDDYWSDVSNRQAASWSDHRDINSVMLAASLMPESSPRA